MEDAANLQRKAKLCRRMAQIPTSGGHRADRLLLTLAGTLERKAAELADEPPEFAADAPAGR